MNSLQVLGFLKSYHNSSFSYLPKKSLSHENHGESKLYGMLQNPAQTPPKEPHVTQSLDQDCFEFAFMELQQQDFQGGKVLLCFHTGHTLPWLACSAGLGHRRDKT